MAAAVDSRLARARESLEGLSIGDAFGEQFFIDSRLALTLIEERALPAPPWGLDRRYGDGCVAARDTRAVWQDPAG
jgi:hypothetical protein